MEWSLLLGQHLMTMEGHGLGVTSETRQGKCQFWLSRLAAEHPRSTVFPSIPRALCEVISGWENYLLGDGGELCGLFSFTSCFSLFTYFWITSTNQIIGKFQLQTSILVTWRHKTILIRFTRATNDGLQRVGTYRSIITGSDGVSLRLPQLFLSQHRLKRENRGTSLPEGKTKFSNLLISSVYVAEWGRG